MAPRDTHRVAGRHTVGATGYNSGVFLLGVTVS